MRVIGGKWKSRKINRLLKRSHRLVIRPTTDRVKENIFNVLENLDISNKIVGARVLDIFCGTGAMGIEAISRGASYCQFIDKSLISKKITLDNISNFCCENETRFLLKNVLEIGDRDRDSNLKNNDIVFLDPPYKNDITDKTIQKLLKFGWIDKNSLIVLEKSKDEIFSSNLQLIDNRIYGNTEILFLKF